MGDNMLENACRVREQLREQGVVLLRDAFPREVLTPLREAAEACFAEIAKGNARTAWQFTPFSFSALLSALAEFGPGDPFAPLKLGGLDELLAEFMDGPVECRAEHSWVRKRFAPAHAPRLYQPNQWHQDGGLGVRFSPDPEVRIPMTRLVTCWLPLQPCGADCPGLEFVRRPLDSLLHYTELSDEGLRRRFDAHQFWAPDLRLGDGVLFLAGTLHRTYTQPEMRLDRLSLEYRFFSAPAITMEA